MVALSKALSSFTHKNILVVGDFILDKYVLGSSKRISPEAPVPVVLIESEQVKAGGAGNVAMNLISMGMMPRVMGRIGADSAGIMLKDRLEEEGVDLRGIIQDDAYCTPMKTRIIATAQQLVRIDKEKLVPMSETLENEFIEKIPSCLEDISLVLISDYAKGTLTAKFLSALIRLAKLRGIPCISDPKGTHFRKYTGSMIVKPNAHETLMAAPPHATSSIEEAACAILKTIDIEYLMVTRSEEGISLFHKDGSHEQFFVPRKEVLDVTGAGDTVLAMLGSALASGVNLHDAIALSNIAASCAVERLGCAQISLYDVARKLIEQNPSGKICTGDLFAHLLHALQKEKLTIIRIPKNTVQAEELIKLSQISASDPHRRAIACFEKPVEDQNLLNLIASLQTIDLVVHTCPAIPQVSKADHVVVGI